jgi:hypothetical protein
MLAAALSCVGFARHDANEAELLKTSSIRGVGVIKSRFIAPNGVTPRLEYIVTGRDGRTGEHNAQISREYWDALAAAKSVPVVYVPSDPSMTRLAHGEIDDNTSLDPATTTVMAVFMGAVCLFFLVGGIMLWNGKEIDFNQATGKFSIKQYGTPAAK